MALREEKVPLTCGKKKTIVRKETTAVSGIGVTIVHKNQNPERPHFPSHILLTRSKCVEEKRRARGKKYPWCHSSTTVQILFERYLHAIAL